MFAYFCINKLITVNIQVLLVLKNVIGQYIKKKKICIMQKKSKKTRFSSELDLRC